MSGYVEKRGEQVYRLRIHVGYDENGKRVTKSITVHGTRREAQRKLAELITELHSKQGGGTVIHMNNSQTVGEYLDFWLTTYVRHKSARTHQNYLEYVQNYIKPALGKVRLDRLTTEQLQSFFDRLEITKRKRGGQPLSPTTVFNCHRVLKGALRRAVIWKKLRYNPMEGVSTVRPAEREPRVLLPDQIAVLLDAAKGTYLYVPILLGLGTGMRRGEICGLRWSDVRFEFETLTIRQTYIRIGPGRYEFKAPKTKSGRRTIKLPTVVVEGLREELTRQEKVRGVLGPTYNPDGLVIIREDGRPRDPGTLYSSFRQLLDRVGIPRMAIHDLRHSHATMLLEAGQHIKVVAERLGHADPGLTMRVYSHVLDHMQTAAAEKTDAILRRHAKTDATKPNDEEGEREG